MSLPHHLVVLARVPRLGQVKSRLARDIGAVRALRFYERTLRHVLAEVAGGPWITWLGVTPGCLTGLAPRLLPLHGLDLKIYPQVDVGRSTDIGGRMAHAFDTLPPGPVVLVGSDIPALTRTAVADAFAALRHADVVFGPAADGGYWLVGARRHPSMPPLFRSVRWSTAHALADTIANLPPRCTHSLVAELEDIDDGAAWARWRAHGRPETP